MKATITQKLVASYQKKAKAGEIPKPVEVSDADLTGFILRVQPSGRVSYIVQLGRGKRITLGDAAVLTPTQGRSKAKVALGAQADGRDPKAAIRIEEGSQVPTLRTFVEERYAPWIKANRKTGAELVARITACFKAEFWETALDQVTAWNVEKWRRGRLQEGRTVATVNRDLSALKAALARAVDWELIDKHPLAKVKPGKVDSSGVVRYLSPDEERRLRKALSDRDAELRASRERGNAWREQRHVQALPPRGEYADHLTPMVLISMNTGLRQGELFSLRWPDVDMIRAMLTVHGGGTKSGQTRHIPLNAEALEAFKTWREQTDGDDLVFIGRSGGRFDNVKKGWAAVLKAAGISNYRWHDQRHHFASRLVMEGVDLNTVRELLGHADLTMTLRYAHLAPEHKAAAVARLVAGESRP
jgi:integrase